MNAHVACGIKNNTCPSLCLQKVSLSIMKLWHYDQVNSENILITCPCSVNDDFISMKVLVIGSKVVKWRRLVLSLNFPLLNCIIPCTSTSCFSFSFESGIVEKNHSEYDPPPILFPINVYIVYITGGVLLTLILEKESQANDTIKPMNALHQRLTWGKHWCSQSWKSWSVYQFL